MNNNENNWVNVRYKDVFQEGRKKHHGVTIRFMTTPQDVPDAWRCRVNTLPDARREMIFEFQYLASKEPSRFLEKDGIKLEISRNSRRIYSITIPVPATLGGEARQEAEIDLAIKEIESWERDGSLRPAHADVIQGMLRHPHQPAYG